MFAALSRWHKRRRMMKSQLIVPYWNGSKTVYGDPFKLYRTLMQGADFVIDQDLIDAVDAGKEPQTTKMIEHVCRVFEIQRWNPETSEGLTDLEIIGILFAMFRWTNAVKKNSSTGPTLPTSTASASSTATEPPAEATKPASPCGSC